jgi:hypothetical protein
MPTEDAFRAVLTDRANLILQAWDSKLVSTHEVRSWAETELMEIADVRAIPGWLLDLVQHGPERLADVALSWRQPPRFSDEFALHATRVDLDSRTSVESFARWLARAAMGQDLDLPEVMLGYRVDDYLDCGDMDLAVQCIREDLPSLLPTCVARLPFRLVRRYPPRPS